MVVCKRRVGGVIHMHTHKPPPLSPSPLPPPTPITHTAHKHTSLCALCSVLCALCALCHKHTDLCVCLSANSVAFHPVMLPAVSLRSHLRRIMPPLQRGEGAAISSQSLALNVAVMEQKSANLCARIFTFFSFLSFFARRAHAPCTRGCVSVRAHDANMCTYIPRTTVYMCVMCMYICRGDGMVPSSH